MTLIEGVKGRLAAVLVAVCSFAACTDTYLYDQRSQDKIPADRTVAIEGEFCAPAPTKWCGRSRSSSRSTPRSR